MISSRTNGMFSLLPLFTLIYLSPLFDSTTIFLLLHKPLLILSDPLVFPFFSILLYILKIKMKMTIRGEGEKSTTSPKPNIVISLDSSGFFLIGFHILCIGFCNLFLPNFYFNYFTYCHIISITSILNCFE